MSSSQAIDLVGSGPTHTWASCLFRLLPASWTVASGCRDPVLIIALLIQRPLPIVDLLSLPEQPVLGSDSQGNHQHDEDEDEDDGEHDWLLLVELSSTLTSPGMFLHGTCSGKLSLC